MAFGIDIYDRYQDVTDWRAVRDHGVRFCIIKATDGGGRAVAPADALVRGARSVGIPVGLYHYAQLSPSPEIQADVLAGEMRRLAPIQLPPVLDLEGDFHPRAEDSPAVRAQKISRAVDFGRRFATRLSAGGHPRVLLYANTSFLSQLRPQTWGLPGLLIWAADYGPNDGRRHPDLSPYTGPVAIHQYTDRGAVPGITASGVDLNESLINILEDDMSEDAERRIREIQAALGTAEAATATPDNPAGVQVGTQVAETRTGVRQLAAVIGDMQAEQAAQRQVLNELAARPAAGPTAAELVDELLHRLAGT